MIYAVLASGESMNQAVADSVRGKCKVIAVSDTWQLAPWADALVSADAGWWRHKAPQFDGPKYTMGLVSDTEQIKDVPMGTNSGLLGVMLAVKLGATKVLLLGVDLHGTHFFGNHPLPLRNPNQARLETFKKQFSEYKPKGVQILNCNPDSALTCYPMARLGDHLEGMAELAAPDSGTDRSVQGGAAKAGVHRRVRMHASARRSGRDGQLEPDTRRSSRGAGL
jgi:hypothetical protein